jgi:hypothetical protein
VTVKVTVVVCVIPPPVAVMVIVRFPVEALRPTLTVIVDVPDPGEAMELGLKVTVCELPCPEAESVIAELKLPEIAVVMVEVPEPLRATVIAAGEAETLKPAVTPEVTVRDTVVVCVNPPPVPVIVML